MGETDVQHEPLGGNGVDDHGGFATPLAPNPGNPLSLLKDLPQTVVRYGRSGRITFVNEHFVRRTGRPDRPRFRRRRLRDRCDRDRTRRDGPGACAPGGGGARARVPRAGQAPTGHRPSLRRRQARHVRQPHAQFARIPAPEQVVGRTPAESAPAGAPHINDYERLLRGVIETGTPTSMTMSFPDLDGSIRTFDVVMHAERDNDGRVVGAITIGREISHLLRAEREIDRTILDRYPFAVW